MVRHGLLTVRVVGERGWRKMELVGQVADQRRRRPPGSGENLRQHRAGVVEDRELEGKAETVLVPAPL